MPEIIEATENIESQRAALEGRLADLEQMNGAPLELVRQAQAAIEARRAEMEGIEQDLAQLDAITSARAKEERAAAHRLLLDRKDALRKQIVEFAEARLKAIADAELNTRQLAASLRRLVETNAALVKAIHTLTGESVPVNFSETDLVRRISSRISAVMSTVGKVYRARFGNLQWQASHYPAEQSWPADEERMVAASILKIIESTN